jgi:mRNA interferase RelE/StbE
VNSAFKVFYSRDAEKQFKKMDKQSAKRILQWIELRLVDCQNPRLWGEALVGSFSEFWNYRVGDFRLICEIKDNELIIQVISVGNRKEIYK